MTREDRKWLAALFEREERVCVGYVAEYDSVLEGGANSHVPCFNGNRQVEVTEFRIHVVAGLNYFLDDAVGGGGYEEC